MAKKKKPTTIRREYADHTFRSFPVFPRPLSLNPGPEVVLASACGSPEATAIADSYRFRFPVKIQAVIQ